MNIKKDKFPSMVDFGTYKKRQAYINAIYISEATSFQLRDKEMFVPAKNYLVIMDNGEIKCIPEDVFTARYEKC